MGEGLEGCGMGGGLGRLKGDGGGKAFGGGNTVMADHVREGVEFFDGEHQIEEFEEFLPVGGENAAGNEGDEGGGGFGGVPLADFAVDPVDGFLADGAGHDSLDHRAALIVPGGFDVAHGIQNGADSLGVRAVHLASEGDDVVFHGAEVHPGLPYNP